MQPRILVVDDDMGVIAAYRCALVEAAASSWREADDLEGLGEELFGSDAPSAAAPMPWRVDFVHQGDDAFEAVCNALMQSDPYTLVFMDIRMPPGIDGCEAARRIRQVDASIKVVFVTGYSDYSEEELIEAAGPRELTSFMQKPVWPEQLRTVARSLCSTEGGRIAA
jgi:CheY-like chemotaxis protein